MEWSLKRAKEAVLRACPYVVAIEAYLTEYDILIVIVKVQSSMRGTASRIADMLRRMSPEDVKEIKVLESADD